MLYICRSLLLIYYRTEAEVCGAVGVRKLLSLRQRGNGRETGSGDVTDWEIGRGRAL
jgi:hypothetical protein